MDIKERLIQQRKARGFSQEVLAMQIGVSRQAVSKWETGEALPGLPQLMALADALTISVDALCGRETSSTLAVPEIPAVPAKPRWIGRVVIVGLVGVLMVASFLAGVQLAGTREAKVNLASSMPEVFSATGVQFSIEKDRLGYQFVPSIAGEAYAYQITFSGKSDSPKTFDAPYSGGLCTDTVALSEHDTYSVTIVVSDVQDKRAVALASDLSFSQSTGVVQWMPAE